MRPSGDEYANGRLMNGFDYENQAWVDNGRYVSCGHPEAMSCNCYGRLHEGEETTHYNPFKDFQLKKRTIIKQHDNKLLVKVEGSLRQYNPHYFEFWSSKAAYEQNDTNLCTNWIVTEDIALKNWEMISLDHEVQLLKCSKCSSYYSAPLPGSDKLKGHCDFCMDVCKTCDRYTPIDTLEKLRGYCSIFCIGRQHEKIPYRTHVVPVSLKELTDIYDKSEEEDENYAIQAACDKLAAEGIKITDLTLVDIPTQGVYIFKAKDMQGNNVAFDLSEVADTKVFTPCLTINSEVLFYNTMTELSKYWHQHDLIA